MLARISFTIRGIATLALVALLSQCAAQDAGDASMSSSDISVGLDGKSDTDVQVFCDDLQGGQKGIQFTLLSRVDKSLQLTFPDGSKPVTLKKGTIATATYVYNTSSKEVKLETQSGSSKQGPALVPKVGSYSPAHKLEAPIEKMLRPDGKKQRKLVTAKNYGLEFSIMIRESP